MHTEIKKLTAEQVDKAWAAEQDRIRDEPSFIPGRSWLAECQWLADTATTDEDREYWLNELGVSEMALA